MRSVCLWGSAEHATADDEARLLEAIGAIGCIATALPRDAAPPESAHAIVINTKRAVSKQDLAAMPSLRLVVTTTSGYDHIDLSACAARGVRVARCALARRDAVVETSVAMALGLLRRLPELLRDAEAGRWVRKEVNARRMPSLLGAAGRTIGVVGMGVIGRHARDVWQGFGNPVVACDPAVPGLAPLDDVLARADVLTLHCSLTRSSHRLLDAARIAKLKPGAIVINTARGECIDLPALLAAKHLGGIGLDVFEPEPPGDLAAIARHDNVFVTPHSAGYCDDLSARIEREVVVTLGAFVRGEAIPNEVTALADGLPVT